MNLDDITLVLGIDRRHLDELRWTWPTWVRFKPEILRMPAIVFYDPSQIAPRNALFLHEHPRLRFVPWDWGFGRDQREKMMTGWVHVPATEVKTPWYLKLDTDVVATGAGKWIKEAWFEPNEHGSTPVFIASPWSFSKPRYITDVLDDWADKTQLLARFPRLNLPYTSGNMRVIHQRMISWLFFGRTDWVKEVVQCLGPDGSLPYGTDDDTFLSYCAARGQYLQVLDSMYNYHWNHTSLGEIKKIVRQLAIEPRRSHH